MINSKINNDRKQRSIRRSIYQSKVINKQDLYCNGITIEEALLNKEAYLKENRIENHIVGKIDFIGPDKFTFTRSL